MAGWIASLPVRPYMWLLLAILLPVILTAVSLSSTTLGTNNTPVHWKASIMQYVVSSIDTISTGGGKEPGAVCPYDASPDALIQAVQKSNPQLSAEQISFIASILREHKGMYIFHWGIVLERPLCSDCLHIYPAPLFSWTLLFCSSVIDVFLDC